MTQFSGDGNGRQIHSNMFSLPAFCVSAAVKVNQAYDHRYTYSNRPDLSSVSRP
jgi:hypothetical protein